MSSMVPEVSPELMAGFLDEAPEYLSILDEGLMAFEAKAGVHPISFEDPDDQARMNEMFRAAHSLKGLGAALGFTKIRDLTHLMESLFDQLRMGKRQLNSQAIETLFSVFDKLKELVQELAETPVEPVTIGEALSALQAVLQSQSECQVSLPVEVACQTTVEAANSPSCNSVLENPELTNLFVETTLEALDDLNQALLQLESSSQDADLINNVFRCAHNIKGATGAAGCETLYRLTHSLETLLDLVRGRKLELNDEMMGVIFSAVDRLRADVQLVKNGRADELSADGTVGLFDKWIDSDASKRVPTSATTIQSSTMKQTSAQSSADTANSEDTALQLVTVTFPKNHPEAAIQAYLVFNRLKELGDVVKTTPDIDALDAAGEISKVDYSVSTKAEAEDIQKVISMYVVEHVAVSRGARVESAVNRVEDGRNIKTQGEPLAAGPTSTSEAAAPPTPMAAPPTAGTSSVTPTASKTAATEPTKPTQKVGETIRVDLERLDQLMNLGGELVINRARLVQIQSRFDPLFREQNLGYLVEDIAERLDRLGQGIGKLNVAENESRLVSDLSDTMLSLTHDFGAVRGLLQRLHECRPAMNDFGEALHSLNRVSEGIQKRIMETRMVSIGPLFQRFRRVVRDISKATGKDVELVLHGEATELDKRMIDELGDPLTHMIRNSVDHGIEQPEQRIKAGKAPLAKITLNAFHRGRHICIEVKDDGRGVNTDAVRRKILERQMATPAEVERMSEKELVQYIFKPGFSTAEKVTDLSGRGMGMDIVMSKLDAINGTVEVESVAGVGCTVTIKLPLTLAIITAIIARIGHGVYAIPLEAVAEIITVSQGEIQHIQRRRVVRVRDRVIPVALFEQIFQCGVPELRTRCRHDSSITLVILGIQNERIGLVVDELIGQEDVVIKSIADNYRNVTGVTGASIMGDGTVSLILDVASMMNMLASRSDADLTSALTEDARVRIPVEETQKEKL